MFQRFQTHKKSKRLLLFSSLETLASMGYAFKTNNGSKLLFCKIRSSQEVIMNRKLIKFFSFQTLTSSSYTKSDTLSVWMMEAI